MKGSNVIAEVVFRSVHPLETKPDFATVGGFGVILESGKEFYFDWQRNHGNAQEDEGHILVGFGLDLFDVELVMDLNEGITGIDWKEVIKGKLHEVSYEIGHIIDGEEIHHEFDVVSFQVLVGDEKPKVLKFTKEQIKEYNEKVKQERQKRALVTP